MIARRVYKTLAVRDPRGRWDVHLVLFLPRGFAVEVLRPRRASIPDYRLCRSGDYSPLPRRVATEVYNELVFIHRHKLHPICLPPPPPPGAPPRRERELPDNSLCRRLSAAVPPRYRRYWTPAALLLLCRFIKERWPDPETFNPHIIDFSLTPAEVIAELSRLYRTEDELVRQINEQWLKLNYQMRVYSS